MGDEGYLLDNRSEAAGARLRALSAIFDPSTFRHLENLGIAVGWRCWEVGAGGDSVVRWMARRVGADGRVLATDIDVSWAQAAAGTTVEVRRHDVALDAPPAESFDLVHARLVLVHVADRDRALRSMVEVLRPGGRLLVEDADPALQPLSSAGSEGARGRVGQPVAHRISGIVVRPRRRPGLRAQAPPPIAGRRSRRRRRRRVLSGGDAENVPHSKRRPWPWSETTLSSMASSPPRSSTAIWPTWPPASSTWRSPP